MGVPPDDNSIETVPQVGHDPGSARAATYEVVTIAGPDVGITFTIDGTQPGVLVGQSPACDVRFSDRLISRRHVVLDLHDRRLHITDQGSMNGTYVNGLAVNDAFLAGGETIQIGATTLRVDLRAKATVIAMPRGREFGRMVGESVEMRRLYPLCERLAATDVPVIIEGETGTGKELLAESLHEQGPRAAGPFVVFDCTAVPPNLIESELFGHERGAFTGAVSTRKGIFEQADGGTVLIDEIGDFDLALQPKLLRALERSEVRRVGGDRPIRVDVRVLCATRRDLDQEVSAGRFRDDLFHRLAVGRVELPPLRRRRGDVPVLAQRFCAQIGREMIEIPDHVLARWETYDWPGNIRELRNAVHRFVALGDDGPPTRAVAANIGDGMLEEIVRESLPYSVARQRLLDEFDRRYVERVLAEHGGNVMRAAAASGVARRHFQRVKARTGL